jgi:hypothetical protein
MTWIYVCAGDWEHFLYVGKIAFFGWFLHFGTLFVIPAL